MKKPPPWPHPLSSDCFGKGAAVPARGRSVHGSYPAAEVQPAGARGKQSIVSPRSGRPQSQPRRKLRIALYSHDTMGLGHKRRNLLIAQTLGTSALDADILMLSGMRDASNCPVPAGVDCLTLPSLHKKPDGQYQARHLGLSLSEIISLRGQVIRTSIQVFAPDVLIVDNVPRGAVKELDATLEYLAEQGHTRCILGLRDVLDEPAAVRRDWSRAANEEAIRRYYDAVWVYGDPNVYDLRQEYGFAPDVLAKIRHTGYLDQQQRLRFADSETAKTLNNLDLPPGPLVLCLVGGGQDGAQLATAFAGATLPPNTNGLILTGPFMPAEVRQHLQAQVAQHSRLKVLEYVTEPTFLLQQADRVIAMGGYNTTCEILSFEKPALLVPRVKPRREQMIRAERLQALGMIDLLHPTQVSSQTLTTWLAQEPRIPQIRDRIDLQGLSRLPQLLQQVLLGLPQPLQRAS